MIMRVYEVIGILVSLTSLGLYLGYFMNISLVDQSYISDNLHRDLFFRGFATTLLCIQHVLVVLYFLRFWASHRYISACGIAFVLVSQSGWFLLISIYTMPWHMVGFSIFVSGIFVYWTIIFVLDQLQMFEDHQEYVIFLASFAFCILYCIFYVSYQQIAWFYEHIGMILFNCAYLCFFLRHDTDPWKPVIAQRLYAPVLV